MRLYSDKITWQDMREACPADIIVEAKSIERPHLREFGWTVRLEALRDSGRFRNSGQYGAERDRAATWDEHGVWMARLFAIDPAARIGPYNGVDDFNRQTDGAYANALDPGPFTSAD